MRELFQNLRFALRQLGKRPAFTVVAVFAAVALLATYLPARRASRVDPLTALETE